MAGSEVAGQYEDEEEGLKHELRFYPQGGEKNVLLREKFMKSTPFFFNPAQQINHRATNADRYQSTLA